MWDPKTPFAEATGPLGQISGMRTLALRTCKADTVVGLPKGEDERLRATEGAAKRAEQGNGLGVESGRSFNTVTGNVDAE